MITLQVYDSPDMAQLLADFTGRCTPRASTNLHGFAALDCSSIPVTPDEAFSIYDWPGTPHCIVSDGAATVVWEGRLEDVKISSDSVSLGGLGYWRALGDAPYTSLWSRTGTAEWRQGTDADVSLFAPERWELDNNNRLYFAPRKNEQFSNNSTRGAWAFLAPYNGAQDIAEVIFSYSFNLPVDWKVVLRSHTEGFGGATTEYTFTSTGVLASGSQTVTLAAARRIVTFECFNATGGTVTFTGNTGTSYAKITSIRVKSVTSATVLASAIAAALVTYANGINADQISASGALIAATTTDLNDEVYEDELPADILDDLALLHGYEVGVWEDRRLHFRAKGSAGRQWYINVTRILELQRSLENVRNSAYALYRDANGRVLRTAVADDAVSQKRLALVRRGFVSAQTTSQTEAEAHRAAYLSDRADFQVRANIEFEVVEDGLGNDYPLYVIRSGDTVTMRNLPPTLSGSVDNIRTFRVGETEYDGDKMNLSPESPVPTLVTLTAQRARG